MNRKSELVNTCTYKNKYKKYKKLLLKGLKRNRSTNDTVD